LETIKTYGPTLKSFYYHKSLPSDLENMKGLVLILHGIEDHGGRYSYVAHELNKHGYGVYAIDHIGHGLSFSHPNEQGDWKAKDFEKCALNAYYLATEMKTAHKELPLFVLGHDFGGYFAQYMMEKHFSVLDGVILSGCGKNNARQYAIYLDTIVKKKMFPDRNRSKQIFERRTAHLNGPFKPLRTTYDWISSDPEEVDKFIIDPLSGFIGTIGFYHEYYSNLIKIPEFLKFRDLDRDFPMLFIGGAQDSLTHKGKDIKKLKRFYKGKGFTNLEFKLYDGARHDIFFDYAKDDAIRDVVNFLNINCGYERIASDSIVVEEKETKQGSDENPYLLKNDLNF